MSNSETIQQRLAELGRVIYAVLVRVKFQNGPFKPNNIYLYLSR